jgi:hypothetical protein
MHKSFCASSAACVPATETCFNEPNVRMQLWPSSAEITQMRRDFAGEIRNLLKHVPPTSCTCTTHIRQCMLIARSVQLLCANAAAVLAKIFTGE